MEAVICPICNGTGKIGWYSEITCHGCEGTGQVESDKVEEAMEYKR